MKEIRLRKLVDEKQLDLHKLSEESALPYATLENWYNTSKFDGDQVGVHELTMSTDIAKCRFLVT